MRRGLRLSHLGFRRVNQCGSDLQAVGSRGIDQQTMSGIVPLYSAMQTLKSVEGGAQPRLVLQSSLLLQLIGAFSVD